MKKLSIISAILALSVLLGAALTFASLAKDLEPCYHCRSTGEFHCRVCNNAGEVVCDGCGGAGGMKCPGEPGKGSCDNGYYVCPSCDGDGKSRPIPADGNADPCGNCGGTGKVRCIFCHTTPGWCTCTRCDGKGIYECQNPDCKEARALGWKCPYCKGAGYLLTNFWPGENDGVQNVPVAGDKIWVNGKSKNYGEPDDTPNYNNDPPAPGGDDNNGPAADDRRTVEVDFAGGTWNIDGKVVTAKIDGNVASGKIEIDGDKAILLEGLDRDTMKVLARGENDFAVTLIPSGDNEVSMLRYEPEECVLPDDLVLSVEKRDNEKGPEDETEKPEKSDLPYVPNDRNSDFEISSPDKSYLTVGTGGMTDEEQRHYADLSDEDLSAILVKAKKIVEEAEPGKSDEKTDGILEALAKKNGFESTADGRFYPILFEDCDDIGFTVKVHVKLNKGDLNGGTDLYVYRIASDGSIEALGKAEYHTYEDGSVEEFSFFTSEFSTVFTSASPNLDTNVSEQAQPEDEKPSSNAVPIIITVTVIILAAAAAGTVIFLKKKKRKQ
ncbi:MAG: hypothetical protein IJS45_05370 [Clostridia bacterium]|nr:hypothetical protein [Clostridia bacterium]